MSQDLYEALNIDDTTKDAIGRALFESCRFPIDDTTWDMVLAKHVWTSRAEAVITAYLACVSHSQGIRDEQ